MRKIMKQFIIRGVALPAPSTHPTLDRSCFLYTCTVRRKKKTREREKRNSYEIYNNFEILLPRNEKIVSRIRETTRGGGGAGKGALFLKTVCRLCKRSRTYVSVYINLNKLEFNLNSILIQRCLVYTCAKVHTCRWRGYTVILHEEKTRQFKFIYSRCV